MRGISPSPFPKRFEFCSGARRPTKRAISRDPSIRLVAFLPSLLTSSIGAPCRLGESSCALLGARSRRRPIDHRSGRQHQHSPRVLAARSPPLATYQHREATDSFPPVTPVPRSEGGPPIPPLPGNGAGAALHALLDNGGRSDGHILLLRHLTVNSHHLQPPMHLLLDQRAAV